MTTPTRNTIMRLAVASACSWIALAAHAQQVAAEAQAPAAAEAAATLPAAGEPAAELPQENVVTVSGSRIAARGFTQPTPTTSLGAEDLAKTAKPNLFNAIAELPALQGSTGRTTSTNSTSSGVQGLSSLSLRGLGPIRTLTLLDGQRVVGANVTGVTDVSQFPQLLVKRVDVVTGGASGSSPKTSRTSATRLALSCSEKICRFHKRRRGTRWQRFSWACACSACARNGA